MDLGLKGLRVIVTAGASGIGAHMARAFAAEGAKLHVCDIDAAMLDSFGKAYPDISRSVCDVADRNSVKKMFDRALGELGGLDCLVNNAGIAGPTGPVHENDPDEWERCIAVCLTSQFYCTRLAVEPLKSSRNGSIINLSSSAGKFGFPNRSAYAAAKWGVVGFTKAISRELGPFGIRCNAILPGLVEGERIERVIAAKAQTMGRSHEDVKREWLGLASVKEMIDPANIADLAVYLASPHARTISGQPISIDSDLQTLV